MRDASGVSGSASESGLGACHLRTLCQPMYIKGCFLILIFRDTAAAPAAAPAGAPAAAAAPAGENRHMAGRRVCVICVMKVAGPGNKFLCQHGAAPVGEWYERMAVGVASCNQVHRGIAANASRCTEAREQLHRWESTRPASPQEHAPPPALRLLERDAWRPAAPLRLLTSRHSGDNGEAARFLPLLQRMQRRQPVTILALGSSITGVHGGCTHPVPLLEAPSCRCPKCCGSALCRTQGQCGRPEPLIGRGWPEPGVARGVIWR